MKKNCENEKTMKEDGGGGVRQRMMTRDEADAVM